MRRISYLFLAMCFCLPLIGCGGDATTTPAAPAAGESGADGSGSADEGSAGSEAKDEAADESGASE